MKKIFLFIFLIFLFEFSKAKAEIYNFFEFAPDLGEKISITANNEYLQRFIPFNDYLSLIRIWVENLNYPSTINFKIFDANNNLLVNKNLIIPLTTFTWSGTPFDIVLDKNLRITSGQNYKFIISTSENNNLKILAFNLLELIQNVETNLNLPETIKPLMINNSETQYSFKIALYEGTENLPPFISNLNYEILNTNEALITFNVNEPVIYELLVYDQLAQNTTSYGVNYYQSCPINIKNCYQIINIEPEKAYNLKLIVFDYWQNSSSAEISFNTFRENQNNEHDQISDSNKNNNFVNNSLSNNNNLNNQQPNNNLSKTNNNLDKQITNIKKEKQQKVNQINYSSPTKSTNTQYEKDKKEDKQTLESNQKLSSVPKNNFIASTSSANRSNLKNEDNLLNNYSKNKEKINNYQSKSFNLKFILVMVTITIIIALIIYIKKRK
jgi:hypothetical protein